MALEEKLKTKSEGSPLEKETKKSFGETLKSFSPWDWTKIAAVNTLGAFYGGANLLFGAANVAATTGSYVLANWLVNRKTKKNKDGGFTKNNLQTEFLLGGAVTPILYKYWQFMGQFSNPLHLAGVFAAGMWPFTAAVRGLKYMFEKYTLGSYIKGLFKFEWLKDTAYVVKDTFTDSLKSAVKSFAWLVLPVMGIRYVVPADFRLMGTVPIRTGYRYVLETHEKNKSKEAPVYQMPKKEIPAYETPKKPAPIHQLPQPLKQTA